MESERLEPDDSNERRALRDAVMWFVSEFPGAGWALREVLADACQQPAGEATRETL